MLQFLSAQTFRNASARARSTAEVSTQFAHIVRGMTPSVSPAARLLKNGPKAGAIAERKEEKKLE